MRVAPAFLPNAAQQLLLRACLAEPDAARAAFAEWRRDLDLDALDGGSVRLLALLAGRLRDLGIDGRQFGKYLGVQRLAWARNQLLYAGLAPLLPELAAEGVRPVLLKGLVLATGYYPGVGSRPIGDADLLVTVAEAPQAIVAMRAQGWAPRSPSPRTAADFAVHHALTLSRDALEIDLHWRLFAWRPSAAGEAALRAVAVPLATPAGLARAPGPADMLMHVCAHGAQFNGLPPIRWVADAAMILRKGGIDWDHFVEQCARFRVSEPVSVTLAYLADVMDQPVPAGVRQRLAGQSVAPIDRLVFAFEQVPFGARGFVEAARLHWHRAHALMGPSPVSLWRYARRMQGGRGVGETARWIARRLGARGA